MFGSKHCNALCTILSNNQSPAIFSDLSTQSSSAYYPDATKNMNTYNTCSIKGCKIWSTICTHKKEGIDTSSTCWSACTNTVTRSYYYRISLIIFELVAAFDLRFEKFELVPDIVFLLFVQRPQCKHLHVKRVCIRQGSYAFVWIIFQYIPVYSSMFSSIFFKITLYYFNCIWY